MKFDDYRACDAISLAGQVRAGMTSAGELVLTATEAARRAHRAFNCLSFTRFDAALQDAGRIDPRPVRGPVLLLVRLPGHRVRSPARCAPRP